VLHATWLLALHPGKPWLALWAEVETAPPLRRRAAAANLDEEHTRARPHPFAAKYEELLAALDRLWRTARPSVRPRTGHTRERLTLWLPSVGNRPLPSPELVRAGWAADPLAGAAEANSAPSASPASPALRQWRVTTLLLDAETAALLLAGLPYAPDAAAIAGGAGEAAIRLGGDLRLWSAAGAFALDLLVRQRYLPGARELPPHSYAYYDGYTSGPRIAGSWLAALGEPDVRARFDALAAAMPNLCRAASGPGEPEAGAPRPPAARALLEDFLHAAVNACITDWLRRDDIRITPPTPSAPPTPPTPPKSRYTYAGNAYREYGGYREYGPYRTSRTLAGRWLQGLAAPNTDLYAAPDEARILLDGLRKWHAGLSAAGSPTFRLCFRLSPPGDLLDDADNGEAQGDEGAHEHDGAAKGDGALAVSVTSHAKALPATQPLPFSRLIVAPSQASAEQHGGAPSENGHAIAPAALDGASAPQAPDEPSNQIDASLGESLGESWRLDYLLQALDDPSLLVPLEELWRERGSIARFVDRRFDHPHEHVLSGLGQAARLFAPIEESLKQAHPIGCELSGAQAYAFLTDALPKVEEAGFGVLAPPWWKRVQVKPTVRLRLKGPKTSTGLMGLDAIVGFDYQVALGGEELSRAELERLAALKEPLVRLRGKWVELRPEQVEAALKFLRAHGGTLSLGEALRVSLTGQVGAEGEETVELEEVSADGWIGELLGRLRQGDTIAEAPQPEALQGTLRPYQRRGQNWLSFLAQYGLGACLADDMGLGKSLELLSLVLHQKAQGQLAKPVLLVCPTSVVGNWEHETARFAPTLRVLTHHGAARVGRKRAERFAEEVAGHDLVLTTYSLLPRDAEALNSVAWGAVVLDEAQNIKNAEAKQSRAARHLSAPVRVALTGTPVENRLAELWSIMDFLNPGYLGSHQRFHERFAAPIEQQRDQTATAQLQSLVRPFVLRRLKTDPNVIRDLPEKLEIREYCPLTREQVTLYEAVVRDGLRTLEQAESPMQRRGVILAMLSKLKQVCNHPAHLLGDNSALKGRSGKLARLEELIEELLAEGDRALIFTQFTAMGDRLQPYLAERFGVDVLYLHGGVPQRARVKLIDRFQAAEGGPPLFLLSLKAGGTGLNLTAANHVIHFDRWWNPAVENQATDRAFRIGQTRNVQVRKFVCSGTLEERIDAMIEQKRALAEQVIGTGEGWLTELSTAQLRDLFSLRASALAK
jgi:SNF2 family DNA or RNA helicase